MSLTETILRKWLTLPYPLHTTVGEPEGGAKGPTVLFIHGIGNSGEAWSDVITKLPKKYRIVTIDLLGFGKSPKPDWMTYDAKQQARAVLATYFRLRIKGKVIIVGHSLGALVAIEIAKRYPLLVRSIILCSPPFYDITRTKRLLPNSEKILHDMYKIAKKHPEQFLKLSAFAIKFGLANKSFNVTIETAPIYMNALEATVINQTSLRDAVKLHLPISVIYGRFDPVMVTRNIKYLKYNGSNVTVKRVLAAHEVAGQFIPVLVGEIERQASK